MILKKYLNYGDRLPAPALELSSEFSLESNASPADNKIIRYCRLLLAILFHHNALFTSLRTLMSYLVPSCNGEESFNKLWSPNQDPNPDHLRGGPSHGYTPSCVNKSSQSEQ